MVKGYLTKPEGAMPEVGLLPLTLATSRGPYGDSTRKLASPAAFAIR